jgi:hypothetical protein
MMWNANDFKPIGSLYPGNGYSYSMSFSPDGNKIAVGGFSNVKILNTDQVSVPSYAQNIPTEFILYQNYPNPFNPSTKISISIPYSSRVKLVVYNILGNVVKEIYLGSLEGGPHEFTWNGKDEKGNIQPSGIYLYSLISDNINLKRKMLLIK